MNGRIWGSVRPWFRQHAQGIWIILVIALAVILIVSLGGVAVWGSRLDEADRLRWAGVAQLCLAVVGLVMLAAILWALFRYRRMAEDLRKAKHYQAWQAISDAQGKPGSGGRIDALQDLHRDGVILDGANLAGGAYLVGVQLAGAKLIGSEFDEADLYYANLQEATLYLASLRKANLYHANLKKADLSRADLEETNLSQANLQEANLSGAKLQKADLSQANLQRAFLYLTNLQEAILVKANLQKANLLQAHLQKADLSQANLQESNLLGAKFQGVVLNGADLSGAHSLTSEQVLSAGDRRGARLPENLKDLEVPADAAPT